MLRANLASVLALIVLCILAFGSIPDQSGGGSTSAGSSGTPTPARAGFQLTVSATTLFQDYKANEVAADQKYKGKILRVSGTIDNIGKDILDNMYVSLKVGQYSILGVQCFFADSHKSKLVSLRKEQQLTVVGRCDGKFGNIPIKDCLIE